MASAMSTDNTLIVHGKHRGQTFEHVAETDRSYCCYILRSPDVAGSLRTFRRHLLENFGGVVQCGKYKWKFFSEVLQEDPSYACWVSDLGTPSPNLKDFQDWLLLNQQPEQPGDEPGYDFYRGDLDDLYDDLYDDDDFEPPPQRRRVAAPKEKKPAAPPSKACVTSVEKGDDEPLEIAKTCAICCERPIKTAFKACGHTMCCTTCALKCKKCPLCRCEIGRGDVLRLFAA